MARLLLMLVVFAGCGRLSFDQGAPSDSAVVDVTPCNPAGHDEDNDGIDDACDVCPQLADDQLDSDRDRVGDACDVAATNEDRVFFDPFTSARPEWTLDARATYKTDSVALPGVGDSIGIQLNGAPGRTVLEVGGRVLAAGTTGSRQVAIHIGEQAGTNNYYCELFDGSGSLWFMLTHTPDEINYNNLDAVEVGGLLDSGTYRLAFVHTPPELTCVMWRDGARYEVGAAAPAGVPTDVMYVAVNNIDTELDYFVRLTTP